MRQAAQRLVHVDDVGAGRVGDAARDAGLVERADLDAVEHQLAHQRGGVATGALVLADGDDVGARVGDRVLVVCDGPVRLPLVGAGDVGDVLGGQLDLRGTLDAAAEDLDLVGQHVRGVRGDVVDGAVDDLAADGGVDRGAERVLGGTGTRERQLDGRGDGAVEGGVLRGEDRREVVPAARGVAVGDGDPSLAGQVADGADQAGGDVDHGVGRDAGAAHLVLDLQGQSMSRVMSSPSTPGRGPTVRPSGVSVREK